MSVITTPNKLKFPALDGEDNQSRFEALCRLIRRGQGAFVFNLIEFDLPSKRNALIKELLNKFPELNIVTVALTPLPLDLRSLNVLDQLEELVKVASPDKKPDVLIITGYETLLPRSSNTTDEQSVQQLARAIQPLNLGRNVLADEFPYPLLLCLPTDAMTVFLQFAPDLSSWRSTFYQFHSDVVRVREELAKAAQANTSSRWQRWKLRRRSPKDLQAEAEYLEGLIADAEALPVESTITARLYNRLGWVCVALDDRIEARRAFDEMQRLALSADDRHLVKIAQQGQRATERISPHTRMSLAQAGSALQVFRGAAALTELEGLYGRDEELRHLLGRVLAIETRFLAVWGETGCGKTSLVQAGLVPELHQRKLYLPIVVRQWDNPELNIREALGQASKIPLKSLPSLRACLCAITQPIEKTVVVICDQFERFFTFHPQRSDRATFLKAVGECINDFRVPCKFIFVVREDELGRLAEFDSDVPEPLEQRKRFYVPLFGAGDAVQVLTQLSGRAGLGWSDTFIRSVVADLTKDGRVRPVELQLVGAALAVSRINNNFDYARAGRAQGLLTDYLELVLKSLSDRKLTGQMMKRVLLSLVETPDKRLVLSPGEIAKRTRLSVQSIHSALKLLSDAHLVRRVRDKSSNGQETTPPSASDLDRYELTHDILVSLVLQDPQGLRTHAKQIVRRALEDSEWGLRRTVGLSEWWFVRRNVGEDEIAQSKVKVLLRRSFIWGIFKWFVLPLIITLASIAIVQSTFGYLDTDDLHSHQIVVRRGLPWLRFLPVLGADTILDTGFKASDLKQRRLVINWQWGSQQSGMLEQNGFLELIKSPISRGTLLCQVGQRDRGLAILKKSLSDPDLHGNAVKALSDLTMQADATLAGKVVDPLLAVLASGLGDEREILAEALGRVVKANPALAEKVYAPLLRVLGVGSIRSREAAARSLSQVLKVKPELAEEMFDPLVDAVRYNISEDRKAKSSSALEVLGQVAQTKPELAERVLNLLVNEKSVYMREAAANVLGQSLKVNPELAEKVFDPLLAALKRGAEEGYYYSTAKTLTQVVKGKYKLAEKLFEELLKILNSRDSHLRAAAVETLGHLASIEPSLAKRASDRLRAHLKSTDSAMQAVAQESLVQVAQAEPEQAETILNSIIEAHEYPDDLSSELLGRIAQAKPELAGKIFRKAKTWLNNPRREVQTIAVELLRQCVQVEPKLADEYTLIALLNILTDRSSDDSYEEYLQERILRDRYFDETRDSSINRYELELEFLYRRLVEQRYRRNRASYNNVLVTAVGKALGQIIQASPTLAETVFTNLQERLTDSPNSLRIIAPATHILGQVALANPDLAERVLDELLKIRIMLSLRFETPESSTNQRAAAVRAMVQVVRARPELAQKVFQKTVDSGDAFNSEELDEISEMLLVLGVKQPLASRFLLDHLGGTRSLMLNGVNANTSAVYRNIVVAALGRWLTSSEPKAIEERSWLEQELIRLRDKDERRHLRIAAWNVFVEAAQLAK